VFIGEILANMTQVSAVAPGPLVSLSIYCQNMYVSFTGIFFSWLSPFSPEYSTTLSKIDCCYDFLPFLCYYLAKASFLQDMLLGMFVFCLFVCFFVCCSESFLTQALHPYHISCIVVPQWQPAHWWHHCKVKVKGQGNVMVKVGVSTKPLIFE
jgi:hypothetical protein